MGLQKLFYRLIMVLGHLDRHRDIGTILCLFNCGAEWGEAMRQVLEPAVVDPDLQRSENNMGLNVGDFKYLSCCLAIGPCKPSGTELDAAEIADDGKADVDQSFSLKMGQDWPPCGS